MVVPLEKTTSLALRYDGRMPEARLAIRDLVLAIIAAVLWLNAGDSTLLQWAAGIGLGVVAYVAHEWSHWLGAKLSGAQVKIAQRLATPFPFDPIDDQNRPRKQGQRDQK